MRETSKSTGADLQKHPDLRLTGVLAHALPVQLGTPDAPERYMVPAVFDRAPLPREVDLIEGSTAREELVRAGYDRVRLRVSDRRLEIADTSLEELKSGLAALIASILHDASVLVGERDDARRADLKAFAEREASRSDAVVQAASEVFFVRIQSPAEAAPLPQAV